MYGKTNADQLRIFLINVHGKSKSLKKKEVFLYICVPEHLAGKKKKFVTSKIHLCCYFTFPDIHDLIFFSF